MGLPRTYVGFSSTDINYYRLMTAWKANEHIDFDFADLQLEKEINSDNEDYIKRICRQKINQSGYFIQLIGDDTAKKRTYVHWEAQVAVEKKCTIIGVNVNKSRYYEEARTPPAIKDIGAIFVPFHAKSIAYALQNIATNWDGKNYRLTDEKYAELTK
jgi:hypothetical protein